MFALLKTFWTWVTTPSLEEVERQRKFDQYMERAETCNHNYTLVNRGCGFDGYICTTCLGIFEIPCPEDFDEKFHLPTTGIKSSWFNHDLQTNPFKKNTDRIVINEQHTLRRM
jgi:hypothetical protein